MAWILVEQFKNDFAAAGRARESQIQMALDAAEDELVELVGQDAVTDALLETPTDADRAAKLIRGHKFLAIATFYLNVRNVKREQDSTSPGTTKQVENEYWTPKEIQEMSAQWRAMALRAIQSYLIVDVAGDDLSSAPEYDHPAELTTAGCAADICCSSNA